jgi:hypothetical protein
LAIELGVFAGVATNATRLRRLKNVAITFIRENLGRWVRKSVGRKLRAGRQARRVACILGSCIKVCRIENFAQNLTRKVDMFPAQFVLP